MRNKSNPKTTLYLVHRSVTCFDQTWSSSGWPQERKTNIFAFVLGVRSRCFTIDII